MMIGESGTEEGLRRWIGYVKVGFVLSRFSWLGVFEVGCGHLDVLGESGKWNSLSVVAGAPSYVWSF